MAREFAQATLEVDDAQQRLLDIEETLYDNVGTLDRFRQDYASRGGEKYRPDPKRTACELLVRYEGPQISYLLLLVPSRHDTLTALREAEETQQRKAGMPCLQGAGTTLSQFVNNAFDLEMERSANQS